MKYDSVSEEEVRYPTSQGTYNKSSEYIKNLQHEIDKLLEQEFHEKFHTPQYVTRMTKDANANHPRKEFVLFSEKLLSASKSEQHGTYSWVPAARPPSPNSVRFYRPNSTHQYLSATDVKNCTTDEVDLSLGRPTRTTLLRARQRIGSASSVTAKDRRAHKEDDERVKTRPTTSSETARSWKERAKHWSPNGDSLHAFLIGSRYTSAHYVDRKTIDRHGVYLPRENPGQFFTKTEQAKSTVTHGTPEDTEQPGTPREAWSTPTQEIPEPVRPATTPTPVPARQNTPVSPACRMCIVEKHNRQRPHTARLPSRHREVFDESIDFSIKGLNSAPLSQSARSACTTPRQGRSVGRQPTPRRVTFAYTTPRGTGLLPNRVRPSPLPRVTGVAVQPSAADRNARVMQANVARARRVMVTLRGKLAGTAGGILAAEEQINQAMTVRGMQEPVPARGILRSQSLDITTETAALQSQEMTRLDLRVSGDDMDTSREEEYFVPFSSPTPHPPSTSSDRMIDKGPLGDDELDKEEEGERHPPSEADDVIHDTLVESVEEISGHVDLDQEIVNPTIENGENLVIQDVEEEGEKENEDLSNKENIEVPPEENESQDIEEKDEVEEELEEEVIPQTMKIEFFITKKEADEDNKEETAEVVEG